MENVTEVQVNPDMTNEELLKYALRTSKATVMREAFEEIFKHQIQTIEEQNQIIKNLTRRLTLLEDKTLSKPGRKKQEFYHECFGREPLTDSDLCDLIDQGYYKTIGKMEKDLGAGKNTLRNRIDKERKRRRMEQCRKEVDTLRTP